MDEMKPHNKFLFVSAKRYFQLLLLLFGTEAYVILGSDLKGRHKLDCMKLRLLSFYYFFYLTVCQSLTGKPWKLCYVHLLAILNLDFMLI